ncbi:hypothetical protein E2C01_100229 [Portunus trituberculatus]|uniref:Uncharacterized protein n=1 Tax=Portunus trituberculatus TaxID=210409 RepID=A0A5B7KIW4_PORTR|nr:hypothetical protein [Portunus trituberculatus]
MYKPRQSDHRCRVNGKRHWKVMSVNERRWENRGVVCIILRPPRVDLTTPITVPCVLVFLFKTVQGLPGVALMPFSPSLSPRHDAYCLSAIHAHLSRPFSPTS